MSTFLGHLKTREVLLTSAVGAMIYVVGHRMVDGDYHWFGAIGVFVVLAAFIAAIMSKLTKTD